MISNRIALESVRNRELFRTANGSRRYRPRGVLVVVVVVVNDAANCATKNAASQLIQFRQARSLGQLPRSKAACVPSAPRNFGGN